MPLRGDAVVWHAYNAVACLQCCGMPTRVLLSYLKRISSIPTCYGRAMGAVRDCAGQGLLTMDGCSTQSLC